MPPKGRKKAAPQAEASSPEAKDKEVKGEENGKKEAEKSEAVANPVKDEDIKPSDPEPQEEVKAPAKKGGWGWAHGRKRKADGDGDGDAAAKSAKDEDTKSAESESQGASKEEEKAPAKKGGWGWAHGRKRKADDDGDGGEPKPKLKPKSSITDNFSEISFPSTANSASGKESNFKIASWNVNGLRAWLEKDGTAYINAEKPDVLCVQELKCDKSKIPAEAQVEGYTTFWLSGDTEGYSGVGIYYKTKPLKITEGIGIKKHDEEGRVITAEYEKFYLVNTYIPNSGRGLPRLKYRTQDWDVEFRKYLKSLDAKKPVVWCGDLNVAHEEIDIRNPKGNKKTAGFTDEERNSFSETLKEGFIDSFRYLNPEEENAYTFWTYMMNARAKNAGWRLDYFVLSERLKDNLCDSVIRSKVMGSDHCPIVLYLAL